MAEELTKKQRRDQKKAFIEAQRQNRTNMANAKKYIVAGVIIVVIIGLFWLIQKMTYESLVKRQLHWKFVKIFAGEPLIGFLSLAAMEEI